MKTRPIKRSAWLLAPALGVLLLALAMWRGQSAGYKRFVSPPLRDGTRYTFLYPARFALASSSGGDASLYDVPQPSGFQLLAMRVRGQTNYLRMPASEITIQNGSQNGTPSTSREVIRGRGQSIINITDRRSSSYFFVRHINWGSNLTRFDSEDAVFRSSFQILPPGAPVPSP